MAEKPILYTPAADQIFARLPGLVLWIDSNRKNLGLNEAHAKVLGYKRVEDALGKTTFDIPCKAVELAETFFGHQAEVINLGVSKKLFGIICFSDEVRAMVTAKKPLVNPQGAIVGAFIQSFEFTGINILNSANLLAQLDLKKRPSGFLNQFEYEVIEEGFCKELTQREFECLFFLMRGKSSKEIGRFMKISNKTVDHHIEHIKTKLGCKTRSEIICKAFEGGFFEMVTPSIIRQIGSVMEN